jgi:hypothetical protein
MIIRKYVIHLAFSFWALILLILSLGRITLTHSTRSSAIGAIKPFVNQETLLMVYYPYFHSIIRYGIIFWGNSSYAINVFLFTKENY